MGRLLNAFSWVLAPSRKYLAGPSQPLATGRCPVAQDIDTRGPNNAAPGANEDRCTQGLRRTRHDIDIDDVLHEEACLEESVLRFLG